MSLGLFYLAPEKWKNGVLLAVSLVFYSMSDPVWLAILLLSVSFDYMMGGLLQAERGRGHSGRGVVAVVLVKELVMIFLTGVLLQLFAIPVPLGLLVYTLTPLGYLVDCYRGERQMEKSFVRFALFCTFFVKIFAGPLVSCEEMEPWMKKKKFSLSMMGEGLLMFTAGFAKQVVLASGISQVYSQLIQGEEMTVLTAWCIVISYAFSIYFTLSGYCDMARGLGAMFGLQLPRNFYYPFQSRTVEDFFNRFNITFTRYVRRYVYLSLGGDSNGFASAAFNTLLVTLLMGLWFGIRINYVMWGIYFTLFILGERYLWNRVIPNIPTLFLRIYTFCVVMMSFTIFAGRSLGESWFFLCSMFGAGGVSLLDEALLYTLSQHYVVIILCFICATSILEKSGAFLRRYLPRTVDALSVAAYGAVLVVCTAMLV